MSPTTLNNRQVSVTARQVIVSAGLCIRICFAILCSSHPEQKQQFVRNTTYTKGAFDRVVVETPEAGECEASWAKYKCHIWVQCQWLCGLGFEDDARVVARQSYTGLRECSDRQMFQSSPKINMWGARVLSAYVCTHVLTLRLQVKRFEVYRDHPARRGVKRSVSGCCWLCVGGVWFTIYRWLKEFSRVLPQGYHCGIGSTLVFCLGDGSRSKTISRQKGYFTAMVRRTQLAIEWMTNMYLCERINTLENGVRLWPIGIAWFF